MYRQSIINNVYPNKRPGVDKEDPSAGFFMLIGYNLTQYFLEDIMPYHCFGVQVESSTEQSTGWCWLQHQHATTGCVMKHNKCHLLLRWVQCKITCEILTRRCGIYEFLNINFWSIFMFFGHKNPNRYTETEIAWADTVVSVV